MSPPSAEAASIPALIFHDNPIGGMAVASLSLLERLIVACHRAGAGPITLVTSGPAPSFRRLAALGISVRVVAEAPPRNRITLAASSQIMVSVNDVRQLLQRGGRLATEYGLLLPIGILPAGAQPWEMALGNLPIHTTGPGAFMVSKPADMAEAQKSLWSSVQSSADGFVDRYFNRPCGRFLSRILVHTPVSPNAVSLASVAIGLAAAWFFAVGDKQAIIVAAVLFQLSAIIDCVDGDLARVLFKESTFGKWLDLGGDQVVHVAVFAAIGIGLVRSGESTVAHWLGLSAVIGTLCSFAVVVRGMRPAAMDRSRFLQKLIDSATNRDFSALVLFLACINHLDLFLWMTAIGSHVFWITALVLQAGPGMRADAVR